MATWDTMGSDSLEAAKELLKGGRHRSCLNRAYYAAYASITGRLIEGGTDTSVRGRPNPDHRQLAALAKHNLDRKRFDDQTRQRVSRNARTLFELRAAADYDPESSIEQQEALIAVRLASEVRKRLEYN